jgi:hypothetical protein
MVRGRSALRLTTRPQTGLGTTGRTPVFLDFDALLQYEHNMAVLPYLAYHNRVAMVAGGTKARIEESGSTSTLVRILEGTHAGKTGYAEETDIIYAQSKKSK